MTGDAYRESLRDGREVWIGGERVTDVPSHPALKPLVDARARIYDMQQEPAHAAAMTYRRDMADNELCPVSNKLPMTAADWTMRRDWIARTTRELGGVVSRIGDGMISGLCNLKDGQHVLAELDPRLTPNVDTHLERMLRSDLFLLSANTDPKGDRSRRPQEQDPDMLLHAVRETDAGIVVRGAKFETGAAYAHEAIVRPTIANWGDAKLSDYALGFICPMNAPNLKLVCRGSYAGNFDPRDYPLSTRLDEIDAMIVFDDVLIPWENVFFYRHTEAAIHIRKMLHRYAAFPFVARLQHTADLMIGAALLNVRQTGVEKQQAVQEKLTELACYRNALDAFLTASVAEIETSPSGYAIPNQSLIYSARVLGVSQLPAMMHIARELCGGQLSLMPDVGAFENPATRPLMEKYFTVNEDWLAEDRRRLLAYARDLLNSSHATHHLMFNLFAQSPPFAHLNAVYQTFDWDRPAELVRQAAGLSARTRGRAH